MVLKSETFASVDKNTSLSGHEIISQEESEHRL